MDDEANEALEALKRQRASWQDDGLGIRGVPAVVSSSSAQLVWPSSQVTRRTDPELNQGDIAVAAEVPAEPT